ncbi:ribonuclease R [Catalinimonas alkaloidigena]|uniref:ribonuclease R n=1 Tax=Catalinimonas alkaloidigena TaxID=1075417 RepID=UPI002404FD9A|nr:ribonuclease R [Catalinimonas alkaloidigena]MDF9798272.1 ribonuclease R [Catalinimonas alkaloidigena]
MSKRRNKQKTRSRSKKQAYTKEQLAYMTIGLLDANLTKAYSVRQITKRLEIHDKASKNILPNILHKLEEEGKVKKIINGKYQTTAEPKVLLGKVDFVNPRFAFIICDELEEDIKVDADYLQNAIDGDIVKVLSFGPGIEGKRPEGEVLEVVERTRKEFVGRVEMSNRFAFIVPDSRKMHHDIFVRLEDLQGAKNNDKVIVKLIKWPEDDKSPVGKVIRVLGPAGENNAEIHSIMAEFDLPFEFPEDVVEETEKIKFSLNKKELSKRRDFRDVTTFTIDPVDAKDFDDALSIKKLDDKHWEIGVHIADVTHYLQENTALEREAEERATSVYLVDRVIPMLPEKLSNELCSLRPHEDRLTFSAVFKMDKNAKVKDVWLGRTVIHSDHRFAYEDAQERIETGKGEFADEVITLNNLAKRLRNERFAQGAVNFETTEVRFRLDEAGNPLEVVPKVRKDAHKMIEEFMLLANKKVAEFVFHYKKRKEKNTFVYRVHDYPDITKIQEFSEFAQRFGYKLHTSDDAISASLNELMSAVEGKPEQDILQQLAIRTMAKAKYTTEAKGHFGLAFEHYSHFTSPIRRYPDVMVHRLLQKYLDDAAVEEQQKYEKKCEHSSEQEKRAADAERASIKYKQVQYMQQFGVDRVFEGIVSGVTEWGVYVEMIETHCEGMVRMSEITDDFYEYDAKNFRIIGQRRKRIIALGDKVKVRVLKTDMDRRTIDLEFVK